MKNYKYDLYLLLIIMLSACSNQINHPIDHFNGKPVEFISPSRIIDLEEYEVLHPIYFTIIDNDAFIINDDKTEKIFNLINLSTKKSISGMNKGQGPGEVLGASFIQYVDNKILAYDSFQNTMNEIVISSDTTLAIKEAYMTHPEAFSYFMIHHLDSTFLAVGYFDDYWSNVSHFFIKH